MVDMQLANNKLVDRGTRMIIEATQLDKAAAKKLLEIHGSVRLAIDAHLNK
jgi:N-acetylmuramic acid 6-phosphate etherase